MKLVQQSKLFFKEGNSDKVFEIDLCELSAGQYLVNFRYGKRGSTLKEGTKTPAALPRDKAELLFAELENEKRKKGYQTETEMFMELPSLEAVAPGSIKGAILQRLQDAATGTNSFKTIWKTSRVIWKAGQLQIEEAIPFIIKLATRGDEMQSYSALWTLIQFKTAQAAPVFNAFAFNIKQKPHLRKLAWEGLLTIAGTAEKESLSAALLEQVPPEIRYTVETNDVPALKAYLLQHTQEARVDYITNLYLLGKLKSWLSPVLLETLKAWPLRPPYFRQIRAVYKLAQLRKDTTVVAALSYRFEREQAMFKRTVALDSGYKQHLSVLNEVVRVGAELKSGESKLAFSHFTKAYFQKNAAAFLQDTGRESDGRIYLQLAVATLLQYRQTDYTPAEERPATPYGQYDYQSKKYTYILFNYPECAESLLLSTILFGNDPARILQPNLKFITGKREVTSQRYYYAPEEVTAVVPASTGTKQASDQPPAPSGGSVIDAAVHIFKNLFGKKTPDKPEPAKQVDVPQAVVPPVKATVPVRTELFPEYWDTLPEAYVQLLMQAQMDLIHRFAYNRLTTHPGFEELVNRFDEKALLQLLNSHFEHPGQLGAEVLKRRETEFCRQPDFVAKVLDSNSATAREWAQQWISGDPVLYLSDLEFTLQLLFNKQPANEQWISALLHNASFAEDRLQVITGKTITELLHLAPSAVHNDLAKKAIARLGIIAAAQMERISWYIVEQLIASPLEANKILAGSILVSKSEHTAPTDIPISLTELFLENDIPEVRQKGIQLLHKYPGPFLVENARFVLHQTDSRYQDVTEAVLDCLRRLIVADTQVGNTAAQHLTYILIRKERYEGSHQLIGTFLTHELKPYWNKGLQTKDITKLVHAQYRNSQLTGYDILKAYEQPDNFSLGQIISFGSHELLAVRQWCWNYFKQNPARIRYERDKALNLLDSKWEDTRAYAFHFFKTAFTEADWDTDTLISIVDSIRPDVESFGKELITRYFKPEHAMDYLIKLSEHPGVNVQAFVSSYLSLYAADQPELLQQLEFYFRSVLTRVHKARVAKDRIFGFLLQEALKEEANAAWITPVIDDISAQATIGDKATCIHILTEIKTRYPHLDMHLVIQN